MNRHAYLVPVPRNSRTEKITIALARRRSTKSTIDSTEKQIANLGKKEQENHLYLREISDYRWFSNSQELGKLHNPCFPNARCLGLPETRTGKQINILFWQEEMMNSHIFGSLAEEKRN